MSAIAELSPLVGRAEACRNLAVSRASFYRKLRGPVEPTNEKSMGRPRPARALSEEERSRVLDTLHAPEFVDLSPAAVYARLLDEEKQYLCSIRTMYRLLQAHQEVRERRNQRRHAKSAIPRLVASAPNQVWTWDITLLRGPEKWIFYYLYVILDLFSRYVVGWMVAERQCGELAKHLIAETCEKEGIVGGLTIHADRGSPMKAKPTIALIAELGLIRSHSRPRTSDDNPFSESQFKTLKSRPDYPEEFGSVFDARDWASPTMNWYNNDHRHSGLGYLTPAMVHHGDVASVIGERREVLGAAFAAHPERFVRKRPEPLAPLQEVWINRPKGKEIETEQVTASLVH